MYLQFTDISSLSSYANLLLESYKWNFLEHFVVILSLRAICYIKILINPQEKTLIHYYTHTLTWSFSDMHQCLRYATKQTRTLLGRIL